MNSIRVKGIPMTTLPSAILLLSLAIFPSCAKNISDDWRTEGLKNTILQVVVRVPLCDRGSASRCREELNRTIQEAGRVRAALLLSSYTGTRSEHRDKTIQNRQDDALPSEGKIVRILCEKKLCDAFIEYSIPSLNGR